MRHFVFILSVIVAVMAGSCNQDRLLLLPDGNYAVASTLSEAQKKSLEKMQDSLYHARAVTMIEERQFVLEADRIVLRNGRTIHVNPMTNFLAVSGDRATLQASPSSTMSGPNGVGGITLDGRVSDVRLTPDRYGGMTLSMNITGSAISASVVLTLPGSGDLVNARIKSNFHSFQADFKGRLVPAEESSVYKGQSI